MNESPQSHRFRVSLRELFAAIACLAVGLTAGPWVYGTMQVAVAAAMVVGLSQEIIAIRRSADLPRSSAVSVAVVWRVVAAIALAAGVIEKVFALRINRWLRDFDDAVFWGLNPLDLLFVFVTLLVLCASVARLSEAKRIIGGGRRRTRLVMVVGLFLVLSSLHLRGELHKLVHTAVELTERGHPLRFQRPGVYPDHAMEGYQFFWLSCGATAAVLLSVFLLLAIGRTRTTSRLVALSAALILCQGGVVAFDLWYYVRELPHVSPELAEGGLQATRADWIVAAVIAVAAAILAAYAMTPKATDAEEPTVTCRTPLHEGNLIVGMAVLGAIAVPIEMAIVNFGFVSGSANAFPQSKWTEFLFTLRYYVQDPWTLLNVAWCLAVAKLALLRWKQGVVLESIRIPLFRWRPFAISFVGIAFVAATGIPALSAFCFASWFSPWS